MLKRNLTIFIFIGMVISAMALSSCTVTLQSGRRSDVETIQSLSEEIQMLNTKLSALQAEKNTEISELEEAKKLLEERLRQEIDDDEIRLEMAEKGLAIIFLAEILFDSGKAQIRPEAFGALDKVSEVLNKNVGNRPIGIEGHTDNDPIKYSGWKSNWELSTARATSVLHYIVDTKGIDPKRVSATGYGENRPVAPNNTEDGRKKNRRVEVVIMPKNIEKIEKGLQEISERKKEIEVELKGYRK